MIRLREVTLARGATRLLDRASLTVHVGQKVGVIGSNGCGKSTLFALLRGEIAAEGGDVEMPAKWRIAHVAQETPAVETPAIDYVLDGDEELRAVEAELAAAEAAHDADGHHVAELHQRFDAIGGYASRARAAELLAGLGVLDARHNDPVARFSGGWRMRLNLAKALMARSDLLLLDEPTNHLDLDAVLWLEEWLKRYPGTLLLITHDRDFLDGVAQAIVHFDAQKLKVYGGNYTVFERERAMQLAMQRAAYDKQQRQIVHLKSFVDRFRAKATKAKQAQSRLRTLERMELIAAAHVDSPFEFAFAPSTAVARELTRLENATLRYAGAAPVFEGLELAIANGERIGYFAQHQLEQLDSTLSPLAQMQRVDPQAREQDLRDFLGGFDFRGDAVNASVARFSGGEKARLVLALIVRARPQLLILDEPTNHLDIEMREALSEALQDYNGALLVVAHDRHLLAATTDEVSLVDRGAVGPFDGDLDDYRDWVLSARSRNAPGASGRDNAPDRTQQKRDEAAARQRRSDARKPFLAEQKRIERDIEGFTTEKRELDDWLATSEAYDAAAKDDLVVALERQGEVAWQLAHAEAKWLDVQQKLDALD